MSGRNKKSASRSTPPTLPDQRFGLRVPRWAFSAAAAVWLLWIASKDYERILRPFGADILNVPRMLFDTPAELVPRLAGRLSVAAACWLCAFGLGRKSMRRLSLIADSRFESALFAAGLGAGAMSLIILALGVLGLWHAWILRAGLIVGALVGLIEFATLSREAFAPPSVAQPTFWPIVQSALIACAALTIVWGAMAPETFYDSLAYHLAIPRLYLLHHRIFPLPTNVFSGPPLGMEMFYGLMLAFDDSGLTALLHGSFALAAAAALYFLSGRRASAGVGRLSAMMFLLCPMTLYAGASSGVDLGASFYGVLALFALLRSVEILDEPARLRWSIAAGLLTGFAMGTKYSVFSFGASLVLVRFWMGRGTRTSSRESLAMAAAAFLALSPWLLKNIFFFKNPVYPFLCGPESCPADWKGLLANAERRDLRATFSTLQGLKDYFLFAWSSCEGSISMDNWPGSAFLMLAPWMLLLKWDGKAAKTAAAAALGAYAAWSLASRTGRFLMPGLPALAYAGALALESADMPFWLTHMGRAAIVLAGTTGLVANAHQGMLSGRWPSLFDGADQAVFLREEHPGYPSPSYGAVEFATSRLPATAKLLLLGETRAFHLGRDCVSVSLFDENPFWGVVRRSRDGSDVRAGLAALGVTHVLVNARGFYNGAPAVTLPADAVLSPVLGEFLNRWTRAIYEDREGERTLTKWILVYELLDRPNPPSATTPNPMRVFLEGLSVPRT